MLGGQGLAVNQRSARRFALGIPAGLGLTEVPARWRPQKASLPAEEGCAEIRAWKQAPSRLFPPSRLSFCGRFLRLTNSLRSPGSRRLRAAWTEHCSLR